jgi:hypothetical protein
MKYCLIGRSACRDTISLTTRYHHISAHQFAISETQINISYDLILLSNFMYLFGLICIIMLNLLQQN